MRHSLFQDQHAANGELHDLIVDVESDVTAKVLDGDTTGDLVFTDASPFANGRQYNAEVRMHGKCLRGTSCRLEPRSRPQFRYFGIQVHVRCG